MVVGESRRDLLDWLNATLELGYTKVEQCGTGAAYCQLMDSVVGGVPMNKVKFESATSEYDYRQNMKILQAVFTKHNITKSIDVERLIKCRLQDNLELLQWFKRYWVENKGLQDKYNPHSRRKITSGQTFNGSRTSSSSSNPSRRATMSNITATSTNLASRRVSSNAKSESSPLTTQSAKYNHKVTELSKELLDTIQELSTVKEELVEYRVSADSLETERNFYFNKLREIEILVHNIKELSDNGKQEELENISLSDFTDKLQTILYSTEEGFQNANDIDVDDKIESF